MDHAQLDEAEDRTRLAIEGYRDAMTYVLQTAEDPYVEVGTQLLLHLHHLITKHDLDARPGRWRSGVVYVRDETSGDIVRTAPDVRDVPGLMREVVEEVASADERPLVVAAMAHLNLVMVHPFRDGNGRMARVLQSLVLVREGILGAEFCSIEEELGGNTRAYDDVLAEVGGGGWNPERDARPWLRFCLDAHHRQAQRLLRRVAEADRAWSELEQLVAATDLPERVLAPLLEATAGRYLRNASYRALAEVTDQAASRDLKRLVDAGLLVPEGEKRGRRYRGAPPLRAIAEQVRDATRPDPRDVYEVVGGG